ncbi:DUF2270 domain-containing protein [Pontibaca methylaminivorans]|uniref:DUF2270 domain-containing protein n=1 Tax=Pontibaca methylaminivorans TaxID=515897 RepID=UPI001F3FB94B
MCVITETGGQHRELNGAEIGAIAHLYRGEVYRSTMWRTRLDNTTNWAVVTLGVALSISYASPDASPLPLVLVGILIILFLMLEARRYRYFNVWRARARWMEVNFYVPLLRDGDLRLEENWQRTLAGDYEFPAYHVSSLAAIGRRIRRNYLWILLIQTLAYVGKLVVHPFPVRTAEELLLRADIGPIPGALVLLIGAVYLASWVWIALWSMRSDAARTRIRSPGSSMG